MSINFTASTITYIANGQAINATVLNAPSVDLFDRTEEILRYSREQQFGEAHFTENKVAVVALPTSNSSAPVLTVTATATEDVSPDEQVWKSYKFSLTNSVIAVKPKLAPGANYHINSTIISSYFNDTQANFRKKELILPGDTLCLKLTKTVDGFDGEVEGVTDQRLVDIGDLQTQMSMPLPDTAEIVKLPLFMGISLRYIDLTPQLILNLAASSFSGFSATLSSGGAIVYSGASTRRLFYKLDGGLYYEISTLRLVDDIVVVGLNSSLSFPRNATLVDYTTDLDQYGFYVLSNLGAGIGATQEQYRQFNYTISGGNQVEISTAPSSLDPEFEYVPIARLGDYSFHIGDRVIPLQSGVSLSGSSVVGWNSVGAPRELNSVTAGASSSTNLIVSEAPTVSRAIKTVRTTIPFKYNSTTKSLTTDPIFDLPELAREILAGLDSSSYRLRLGTSIISRISVSSFPGSTINLKLSFSPASIFGTSYTVATSIIGSLDTLEVPEMLPSTDVSTVLYTSTVLLNHYGTNSSKLSGTYFSIVPLNGSGSAIQMDSYSGQLPQITVDISLIPV